LPSPANATSASAAIIVASFSICSLSCSSFNSE